MIKHVVTQGMGFSPISFLVTKGYGAYGGAPPVVVTLGEFLIRLRRRRS